LGRLARAGQRP